MHPLHKGSLIDYVIDMASILPIMRLAEKDQEHEILYKSAALHFWSLDMLVIL